MNATRFLSAALAATMLATASPALADDGSSSFAASSSSASSRDARCARFSKANDYDRCVRLLRHVPVREDSSSSVSSADGSGLDWQWKNVLGRMEAKVGGMVKFASVMAKKFCKELTDDADEATTSKECMQRMKTEMQTRVSKLIDEAFRGDLPTGR
jgi:hypothetical protein